MLRKELPCAAVHQLIPLRDNFRLRMCLRPHANDSAPPQQIGQICTHSTLGWFCRSLCVRPSGREEQQFTDLARAPESSANVYIDACPGHQPPAHLHRFRLAMDGWTGMGWVLQPSYAGFPPAFTITATTTTTTTTTTTAITSTNINTDSLQSLLTFGSRHRPDLVVGRAATSQLDWIGAP